MIHGASPFYGAGGGQGDPGGGLRVSSVGRLMSGSYFPGQLRKIWALGLPTALYESSYNF